MAAARLLQASPCARLTKSFLCHQVVGFTAYGLPKNSSETINKGFFKKNKSLVNSQYTNSRQVRVCALILLWHVSNACVVPQVSHRCQLEQGSYLIVPTTFEPGQESSFTLRVYSSKPLKLK